MNKKDEADGNKRAFEKFHSGCILSRIENTRFYGCFSVMLVIIQHQILRHLPIQFLGSR